MHRSVCGLMHRSRSHFDSFVRCIRGHRHALSAQVLQRGERAFGGVHGFANDEPQFVVRLGRAGTYDGERVLPLEHRKVQQNPDQVCLDKRLAGPQFVVRLGRAGTYDGERVLPLEHRKVQQNPDQVCLDKRLAGPHQLVVHHRDHDGLGLLHTAPEGQPVIDLNIAQPRPCRGHAGLQPLLPTLFSLPAPKHVAHCVAHVFHSNK